MNTTVSLRPQALLRHSSNAFADWHEPTASPKNVGIMVQPIRAELVPQCVAMMDRGDMVQLIREVLVRQCLVIIDRGDMFHLKNNMKNLT